MISDQLQCKIASGMRKFGNVSNASLFNPVHFPTSCCSISALCKKAGGCQPHECKAEVRHICGPHKSTRPPGGCSALLRRVSRDQLVQVISQAIRGKPCGPLQIQAEASSDPCHLLLCDLDLHLWAKLPFSVKCTFKYIASWCRHSAEQ